MKKIFTILIIFGSIVTISLNVKAQCTPDPACIEVGSPGQICPLNLQHGLGVPYSQVVTIIPPDSVTISGSTVGLVKIKWGYIGNLPAGLTYSCNPASCEFAVTSPLTRYCILISGTPTTGGIYRLLIHVIPYISSQYGPVALPEQIDTSLTIAIIELSANQTTISSCTSINFQSNCDSTYTSFIWSFPGATPNTSSVNNPTNIMYSSPGNYNVTLIVSDGVNTDTLTYNNYIHVIPFSINAGSDKTLICGGNVQLDSVTTNYNGTGMLTYSWLPVTGLNNASIQNPISTVITNQIYHVTVTTDNGCIAIDSVTVYVNPLTINVANNTSTICGTPVILTTTNNYTGTETLTYNWQPSVGLNDTTVSNPSANPGDSTTYTVSLTTPNGCVAIDQTTVTLNPLSANQICLVTVDTLTWKNKIIWEKEISSVIDSYSIYKEVSANVYNLIGSMPYDSASFFIDYSSVPESHGDKYKISIIDTCSLETVKSKYHKTMNLVISTFGSTMGLSWTEYVDESGIFVPGKYYIYRGTQPNNMSLLDSISSSFTSYNDNNVFNQYYYMVGVKKANGCNAGTKSTYSTSFSNKKQNTVGINDNYYDKIVQIYPNPTNGSFRIDIEEKAFLEIINYQGQIIEERALIEKKNNFDISKLSGGVYTLRIKTDKGIAIKKLIKD